MVATMSVVILGAGGHAKVVISALLACHQEIIGVFDDNNLLWNKYVQGIQISGPISNLKTMESFQAVIAIGENAIRRRVALEMNLPWISVQHPASFVSPTAHVGIGSVIMAGAIIQPDSQVNRHCIVNTGAVIEHDCEIGEFAHIGPGVKLAGGVCVEENVFLGVGACVLPRVRVGAGSTVGAGAVVVRDVQPGSTVVGVPAVPLKRKSVSVVAEIPRG